MLQHLNRIQVQTLTWPLQNLNFVFLEPFRGGLAGVFGIIVLLHNPSALELEVTNWRPDILLQDFLIRVQNSWFHQLWQVTQVLKLQSSPRPSHYLHHVWLLVWCSFYEMLCWFYARCNGTHTFQKVQLLSHQSTEYLPKSLGDHQDIFWQMWNEPLCSFWSAVAFALELSHGCLFAQSLSYCWIMNTDLNWGYWGLQFFRCCSGFFYDLLDESSLCSWSNFGRPATPGKVHHCSKFSPFVDNGSDRGLLESQSPRNGFITLSRLIHVNYFVSHLFLNFFRSGHDVLLFNHASLYQTGSI